MVSSITNAGNAEMTTILALFFICIMWVPVEVVGRIGIASNASSPLRPKAVSIGALFTFDSVIGKAAKPAILAAVDDVNSDPNILSGTKLNLVLHDTNCSGFTGTVEGIFLS